MGVGQPLQVRADHFSGATVTYTCLGGNFYTVNLDMYLNCAGVAVSPQTIRFHNQCGVFFQQANIPVASSEEVSPLCPNQASSSSCQGGVLPGFRRYRFTTTVYLSPCNYWTIGWSICCRNTTENLQNTPGIYAEATLNNLGGVCDNSPRFADNGVPFLCTNVGVSYNPGASDPNGNQMVFSLVAARHDSINEVLYRGGYSGNVPIPSISISPITGQLDFYTSVAGNYVVVIKVATYNSSGQLIGYVMRDLMFVILNCDGTPPIAAALSNASGVAASSPTSVAVCQGQSFCVDMVVNDANPSSVITMSSNASTLLPGATFTVTGANPATGRLCWTANTALLPANVFIDISDGACPIENTAGRSIFINNCVLLSAEFVGYQAAAVEDKVLNTWSTAANARVDRFVVERSRDGTVFQEVGRLPARPGSGGLENYEFVDEAPMEGLSYYHVVAIDDAGGRENSLLVAVDRGASNTLRARYAEEGVWTVIGVTAVDQLYAYDAHGRSVQFLPGPLEYRMVSTADAPGMTFVVVERGAERHVLRLPPRATTGDVLSASRDQLR